jgi:transcriptional regulator with XRE-family HTH domain
VTRKRADIAELHRRIEGRVDAWLDAQGKTRLWLAKEAGLGSAHLRRVLAGPGADVPTSPSLATLDPLAAVLGVGVDELIAPLPGKRD